MKHSKKGSRGPRLYFSHFQNRILCAFLLCTLIPIFIIGGISYAVSYNIAKDKILNASISADAQLHTQFDNRLQQVENIADTLQYNMYNLMQADAPMDTLAMLSKIRSNLSMFKTSFDRPISIYFFRTSIWHPAKAYTFSLCLSFLTFRFQKKFWKIREHPLSGFIRICCLFRFL